MAFWNSSTIRLTAHIIIASVLFSPQVDWKLCKSENMFPCSAFWPGCLVWFLHIQMVCLLVIKEDWPLRGENHGPWPGWHSAKKHTCFQHKSLSEVLRKGRRTHQIWHQKPTANSVQASSGQTHISLWIGVADSPLVHMLRLSFQARCLLCHNVMGEQSGCSVECDLCMYYRS